METGRTNPVGADQRQRRQSRQAPQGSAEIAEGTDAGEDRTRSIQPIVWPEHYYLTAQEWMRKFRLIRV